MSSPDMLARQRQELILEEIRRHGAARVSDLVAILGVSDMTVRRDIAQLTRRGLGVRVHGGITSVAGRSAAEPGFLVKSGLQPTSKLAIARAAAELVEPGASIALSAGTTTYCLAQQLTSIPDLTVVTNSPPVADLLHDAGREDVTVVLTGGVRTPSNALVGPVALAALSNLHVDMLFLGVHGISDLAGLTTPNLMEAETNRALVSCARQLVVVTDHTKWRVVGLSTIAALSDVDVLIIDDGATPVTRREIAQHVGRLIVSPTYDAEPLGLGSARKAGSGGRQPS